MKPLTRYAMGTGMNVEPHMAPWPEGPYYRVDKVDAVIRELEAERDAARADAERMRGHMRYFVDNDFNRVRKQRDQAYTALERIAGFTLSQFHTVYDMADACVHEAVAVVGEQEDSDAD